MPTTTGSHPVPTINAPVNGTLIDANTVRGNDNSIRTAYNNHDADPGVHLQSSTFANRPLPGVTGRKWMTIRDNRYELWYDDGSAWRPIASPETVVLCVPDSTITRGQVVRLTGYNTTVNAPTIAPVASAAQTVLGVATEAGAAAGRVTVMLTGVLTSVNTAGTTLGATLYSNGAGGWTATKPVSGEAQIVGTVLRVDAATGVVLVQIDERRFVDTDAIQPNVIVRRDGSGNILGSISGAASAGLLTGTVLASNVVTSSLQTFGNVTQMTWNGVLYTLPPADGSAGHLLSTNGAGGTSWVAPGAAAAGSLTGTTLAAGVVDSSLQTFGNIGPTIQLRGVTYTLPAADGTAGQNLATDGAGVLSWASAVGIPVVQIENTDGTGLSGLAKGTENDVVFTSKTIDTDSIATLGGGGTTITLPAGVYAVDAWTMFVSPDLSFAGEAIVAMWLRRSTGEVDASGPGARGRQVSVDLRLPLSLSGVIVLPSARTFSVRVYADYSASGTYSLDSATRIFAGNRRAQITFIKIA
jgi:hypothetical protein